MGRFINFGFIDWDTIHCWGDSFESIPPRMSGSTRMTLHFSKKSISIKPWFAPGVWGVDGFETPAETWRSFLTTQIFPRIWRFFHPQMIFTRVFLFFQHVKKLQTPWRKKVGTPEGLMVRVAVVPLKVGFYRGVGVRLLCRSQSLLWPLTAERSTEGPGALLKCVFRCGHNGFAHLKKTLSRCLCQTIFGHQINIIWIHLKFWPLVLAWHHPQVLLLVGLHLAPENQVNQRRSRFLLQCVQQLRSNLRRIGGELLVAAESPETFLPRLAEGRWKVPSRPQAFENSPPKKWCSKKIGRRILKAKFQFWLTFFLSKISFWHSLFSCICILSRHWEMMGVENDYIVEGLGLGGTHLARTELNKTKKATPATFASFFPW